MSCLISSDLRSIANVRIRVARLPAAVLGAAWFGLCATGCSSGQTESRSTILATGGATGSSGGDTSIGGAASTAGATSNGTTTSVASTGGSSFSTGGTGGTTMKGTGGSSEGSGGTHAAGSGGLSAGGVIGTGGRYSGGAGSLATGGSGTSFNAVGGRYSGGSGGLATGGSGTSFNATGGLSAGGVTGTGGRYSGGAGGFATGGATSTGGTTSTGGSGSVFPPGVVKPKITIVGDSISAGPGCYKKYLLQNLTKNNYSKFEFVGEYADDCGTVRHSAVSCSNTSQWTQATFTMSNCSQGKSFAGMTTVVKDLNPDLIMLQLGVNDVWGGTSTTTILANYATLIQQARAQNKNVVVVVAQINKIQPNCTDTAVYARAQALVNAVPAWAKTVSTAQSPVFVADLWTNSDYTQSADCVHPDDAGAQRMGLNWYNALKGILTPN